MQQKGKGKKEQPKPIPQGGAQVKAHSKRSVRMPWWYVVVVLVMSILVIAFFLGLPTLPELIRDGQSSTAPVAGESAIQPTTVPPVPTEVPATDLTAAPEQDTSVQSAPVAPAVLARFVPQDIETLFGRWADDVIMPENLDVTACWRAWRAVNPNPYDTSGDPYNAPWVHLLCDLRASNLRNVELMFDVPTHYQITGSGLFEFVVVRDHGAMQQLRERGVANPEDPYMVALRGDPTSPNAASLSFYLSGSGLIQDADGIWHDLSQVSFLQVSFPHDLEDGLIFRLDLGDGASVALWQGAEELTETDCPCGLHSAIQLPTIEAK